MCFLSFSGTCARKSAAGHSPPLSILPKEITIPQFDRAVCCDFKAVSALSPLLIPDNSHKRGDTAPTLRAKTLVWTRGKRVPLSRLESRLRCPMCGSRRGVDVRGTERAAISFGANTLVGRNPAGGNFMVSKKRLREIKVQQKAEQLEIYKTLQKKAAVIYRRLHEIEQAKSATMGADVLQLFSRSYRLFGNPLLIKDTSRHTPNDLRKAISLHTWQRTSRRLHAPTQRTRRRSGRRLQSSFQTRCTLT
jgi:hypothetical protein